MKTWPRRPQAGRKGLVEHVAPALIYLIYRLPPEDRMAE